MFSVNLDDEKNKKKKSDELQFINDGQFPSKFGYSDGSFMDYDWQDDSDIVDESYDERLGKNPFFKKQQSGSARLGMNDYMPTPANKLWNEVDSVKNSLEFMSDSAKFAPFRYYERIEPWEKHLKKINPKSTDSGLMGMYASSQQAIDDISNNYYNAFLHHAYDKNKKKLEEKIRNVMNANKNPYAAVSMAQYLNDPMKVIDDTMNDVDMETLRTMVEPIAFRVGFDTDEYIDRFIKPTLKNIMIREYVDKNKPKNSFEYILRSANANSLFGQGVNLAIGNKSRMQLERESLAAYDASRLEDFTAGVAGLLMDGPVFKGLGMASNAVVGKASSLTANKLASRVYSYYTAEGMTREYAKKIAERMVVSNLGSRIAQSAATTGLTLGTYDLAHSVAEDVLYNESVDREKAGGALVKGLLTGGVLGTVGTLLRNGMAGLTGGRKVAASAGVLSAESAVFTASGEIDKALHDVEIEPIDILNDFGEGLATLGIMKLTHKRLKGAEYKLDRLGKLKEKLQLSKSEVEELNELNMNSKEFMEMVENLLKFPSTAKGYAYNDVVERYFEMMQSKDVSATTKSKLMYLIENKITSTPPLEFEYSVEKNERGNWILTTYDSEGNKIERHVFEHAGNAKNYLLTHKGDFRKNRIATYERELLQVFDSQNLLRQAGLYAKENGVSIDEVSEALYKRAKNMELTSREGDIVRGIVNRAAYNETGMIQFLADMRREIENRHALSEGSLFESIDLPFYKCTKAVNAALNEYEELVRNEVKQLKKGTDPVRAAELEELGRNSALKGMSNEEVKEKEVLDFHTKYPDRVNPEVANIREKLVEIDYDPDSEFVWNYEGLDNTVEHLKNYQAHAEKMAEKFNIKIEYVWDERDIPRPENPDKYDVANYNNKVRAKGWAENGNKVVINLPNIKSIEELEKTVVHEVVVHVGLPKLFGNHFNQFLEEIYRRATPGVRSGIHDMKHSYKVANNYTLIEEYLASLVEKGASSILDSSFFKNLKNFVKNSLVKMNLYSGRNRRVTDEELISLLRQHAKYMSRNTEPSKYRRWVFGQYDVAKENMETYTDREQYGNYINNKISEGRLFKNTPRWLYNQKAYNNYEYLPEETQKLFQKRWNATDEEIRRIKFGDNYRLGDEKELPTGDKSDLLKAYGVDKRLEHKYNEAMNAIKALENARSANPDFDNEKSIDQAFAKEYQFAPEEFKRRFPSIDEYIIYKLSSGNAALPAVNGNKPLREHAPIKSITDIKRFFTGPLDIIHEALQKYWGNGNSMR